MDSYWDIAAVANWPRLPIVCPATLKVFDKTIIMQGAFRWDKKAVAN